eukprot:2077053-Prorocentrum_lima.AAC.1
MRNMHENLIEDMSEDEYEAPPSLGSNETTPPSSPGSSHWARSAKNWELTSRLKESTLVSIESMEEAERRIKDMEYDFTWFGNPARLIYENGRVP